MHSCIQIDLITLSCSFDVKMTPFPATQKSECTRKMVKFWHAFYTLKTKFVGKQLIKICIQSKILKDGAKCLH